METATLAAGDYSLRSFGSKIAIERKELGDLIGCLGRDRERFTRELERLRGYDAAAVVVESPLVELRQHRYLSGMDADAAWQSCLAFMQRYRVPFIFAAGREDAEATTFHLLRHYARDRWKELAALQPAAPTCTRQTT